MAVNTAITFLQHMKIYHLIESEQESAEREAVMDVHLYRGITTKLDTTDIVRIPIRQDRRPRNADHAAHVIFNAFFEMKHGVPDVRSRAMFCTTDIQDASPYTSGDTPGQGGHVVRVFPLKSSKAAFIPEMRDTLDFIEYISDEFIRGLKGVVGRSSNMDQLMELSKFIQALDNGPAVNCLHQINTFIANVNGLCTTSDQHSALQQVKEEALDEMSNYKVISATEIDRAVGHNPVELMVFDAQYYYAQINSLDHDDETIAAFDDEDFPF